MKYSSKIKISDKLTFFVIACFLCITFTLKLYDTLSYGQLTFSIILMILLILLIQVFEIKDNLSLKNKD